MWKIFRKVEDVLSQIMAYSIIGALTLGAIGLFVVTLRWVMSLVGGM